MPRERAVQHRLDDEADDGGRGAGAGRARRPRPRRSRERLPAGPLRRPAASRASTRGQARRTVPAARPVSLRDPPHPHLGPRLRRARQPRRCTGCCPRQRRGGQGPRRRPFPRRAPGRAPAAPAGTVWDYGFGLDSPASWSERLTGRTLDATTSPRPCSAPLGYARHRLRDPARIRGPLRPRAPRGSATGKPQVLEPDATRRPGSPAAAAAPCRARRITCASPGADERGRARRAPGPEPVFTRAHAHRPARSRRAQPHRQRRPDPGRLRLRARLAVRTRPGVVRLLGSVGDFSWPGSSGTNWWVDPGRKLAVVFMAHTPGTARWRYRYLINSLVYQALER